jgi:hypothetical protein
MAQVEPGIERSAIDGHFDTLFGSVSFILLHSFSFPFEGWVWQAKTKRSAAPLKETTLRF